MSKFSYPNLAGKFMRITTIWDIITCNQKIPFTPLILTWLDCTKRKDIISHKHGFKHISSSYNSHYYSFPRKIFRKNPNRSISYPQKHDSFYSYFYLHGSYRTMETHLRNNPWAKRRPAKILQFRSRWQFNFPLIDKRNKFSHSFVDFITETAK